jgi:hypothetical protein
MSIPAHPRAVFGVKKKNAPGVLARAQAMLNGMTAQAAQIPSPPISLVAFLALITSFSLSQQNATETKARGSATVRNTKRDAVIVAESTAATPKAVLTATLTTTPGEVHLDANASLLVGRADARKNRVFNWEWSGDGGETWNSLPSTPVASTDVTGLALLRTYSFRVSVTIRKVPGAWSQAVSVLVH